MNAKERVGVVRKKRERITGDESVLSSECVHTEHSDNKGAVSVL